MYVGLLPVGHCRQTCIQVEFVSSACFACVFDLLYIALHVLTAC